MPAHAHQNTTERSCIFTQLACSFSEAPQRPVIRVESKRDRLEEGDILKLKCEAIDGEPEGKLSWLKGGFVQQFVSPPCMGSNPDSVCMCVRCDCDSFKVKSVTFRLLTCVWAGNF